MPLLLAAVLLGVAVGFAPGTTAEQYLPWMPTLDVGFALRLDGLSLLFSLLVLVIGAGVLAYSARYLGTSGNHGSFYLLMTAFAAAMLLLVLADNLVVLFVAWEATTLCSFFLIARSGPKAREPAIRTLLVTAAGGLSLLAALAVIVVGTGTTGLSEALASPIWQESAGFSIAVAALLAGAAFTKSAQFPFQSWLPDSMVAITPVSAYLHAAAMVKAGIYLLLRFSPVLAGETVWMVLLISAGLTTALFGAIAALRRTDLKELLAYSTMSQLGLLVAMIGIGTPAALTTAVVHTVAHALFKSALFMLIGVIDKRAGTRDIRELAGLRLRMPVTATVLGLAAASMAGIPLLLGFVSKELMFAAFLETPGPGWVPVLVTALGAATAVLTFAYSGRIVLGAFSGRNGNTVREASAPFYSVPALGAIAGLAPGIAPFVLDGLVSDAASATAGEAVQAELVLWHGLNPALAISAVVLSVGTMLVLARRRVDTVLAPVRFPFSGLAIVDALRSVVVRFGATVGELAGSRAPRYHLAVPMICVSAIALIAVFTVDSLPPIVGSPAEPLDWTLVALVLVGVVAAVRAQTRIAAIVVIGVVGFAMTLWYFVLGAADVALTQLLVEILTVCVMVLLLRRLPARFGKQPLRNRIPAGIIAIGAGLATAAGVWALTGRREMSEAASFFVREGETATGGSNIVNTILVDFRAMDTLGELTVLGVAGIAVAALLHSRHPTAVRSAHLDRGTPLADARANSVFVRTTTRLLGPVIVALSLLLLLRGHYEPGGGFIAALIGGAGFTLLYLAAPTDSAARVRWPYLTLIGAGIVISAGTGYLGYLEGSFLTPLHVEILGIKLTSALLFDIGVYSSVIGIVLAAFNLLGRRHRILHDDDQPPASKEVSYR
ncbi:multisubunit sodium/proton antiporter MrpA subunit /multisubunit sodium/proton antiporter MrpB subunit [Tamaricihabitans halophyticus]|uniref:Multisubunit sodium/proton antiporter MrpA subunit /multisubunit sodium/proton antiporter MrpB subunit n=1 Tax=Tamaricihabitans halophyticus TaxID=1262583 RepID=A0A4R2QSW7_9PSEU|nr:multisubunit sodium/proton antiporter MrpA subunit /multisubunit sodium/proton antiporter MrpB subunit [Tamaricihabitans halophyticus]